MGKPQKRNDIVAKMALELYGQLGSGNAVAKKMDLAPRTVYRMLHDAGIHVPGWKDEKPTRRKFSPEKEQQVVADYLSGMSLEGLEAKHGKGQYAIRAAVRRAGHKLRDHGAQRRRIREGEAAKIALLYRDGLSQTQLATLFGCHQTVISSILKQLNVPTRFYATSGPGSSGWRGGLSKTDGGYILQYVERPSPFESMITRSGYVMQHRLVMAMHLGRPLLTSESVHHINGDRTDNRIENLQLRQGKHGTGTVMCCADCGSQRIVHRELE